MANTFASLYQLISGFEVSQVAYVVAKFGFADFLKDGPKSGEEIAQLAKTHPENTNRVLRAASGLGIFVRDPETLKYSLNEISRLLLDGPTSLRYGVLHTCEQKTQMGWMNLDKAVESGAFPFKEAYGVSGLEYMKTHPESSDRFNRAMTAFSALFPLAQVLTSHYTPLQEAKKLVDVGGGFGILTTELLRHNPHLHGISFDLPHVIEDARSKKIVNISDVESRFEYASGSFFESIPAGADIYTLKSIIHDWDDAKAIEILTNIRKVMPDNGKIIVIETILKETGDIRSALMDLHMLVMLNAKERTEEEFRKIFEAAGLQLSRVISLSPSFMSALEAVKK